MRAFKDTKSRQWKLSITVGVLDQICEELGDDIFNDPTNISMSPKDNVHMLWITVEDQAEAKGVTPRDFGRALDGETLREAMNQWMGALADFFSALLPGRGKMIEQAWQTSRGLLQIEERMVDMLLGNTSIDSEELQELTLALSPFGNSESWHMDAIPKLKELISQVQDGELEEEEMRSQFHSILETLTPS